MVEITELRKEFAVCLEQLALTLKTIDVNSPTDIDIKVAEFLASPIADAKQKQVLLSMVEDFKRDQIKQREKPRHLSVIK